MLTHIDYLYIRLSLETQIDVLDKLELRNISIKSKSNCYTRVKDTLDKVNTILATLKREVS